MQLKKTAFYAFILLISLQLACRQKDTSFGNNPEKGSYFNIRGFKMYYEVYGKGEPVLLIHGNGGSIQSFATNIPYFSGRYQVIAADSRAHGKSADTRDSLTFEMMADDYAALMDSLHIRSANVIGWSDGGINALVMAMRHPEKVRRLAATGANLWPDSTALDPGLWKDEYKTYEQGRHKVFKTAKEKNDWKVFLLDWQEPHISLASLKQVTCPALIISGDHDLINLEHTLQIYKHLPKAQLWVLPHSGHATLQEHTEEFNHQVDAFFRGS